MTTPQEPGEPGQQGENKPSPSPAHHPPAASPMEPMPAAPALNEQEMAPLTPANRPKSVDNAWLLWMIGAGLSLISLIVSLTVGADDIKKGAEDSLKRSNTTYTQDELDNLVTISTVIVVVFSLAIIGLFVLFAYKMRAGRNWARITLSVLGGVIIVLTLLGVGAAGVASLIVGLIQALLILGAVYFMYRPDANQYFAHGRVRR